MEQNEDWFSQLQSWFTGMGIVSAIFMLALEIKYVSDILGTQITSVRFWLLILSSSCFILGGVKTLQMSGRFFKVLENIKKGEKEKESEND